MTPRRLYSVIATAEMFTWALLILGMILKYSSITPLGVKVAGPIHGFTFLCFGAATLVLWINNRWPAIKGLLGLASTIIPFCTVPFERSMDKAGLLSGPWRFRNSTEQPQSFPEHLLAFVVRKPVLATVMVLVMVSIIFTVLLILGPPYQGLKE